MSRITRYELAKIFGSKLLWIFLAAALAINVLIVYSENYYREDMVKFNALAERIGVRIDDNMREKMSTIVREDTTAFCALWAKETGTSLAPKQACTVFVKTDAQQKMQQQLQFHSQLAMAIDCKNLYPEALYPQEENLTAQKEENSHSLDISGIQQRRMQLSKDKTLQSILRWQNEKLEPRLKQINAQERNYLSPNYITDMHGLLYAKLLFACLLEMLLFSAFLIINSQRSEFTDGTQLLVYSTKHGRALQGNKLKASILTLSASYLLVCGGSLGAYFLLYPQTAFYDVPIASYMNGDILPKLPFTMLSYLGAVLAFGFLLVLLFAVISYCFALFCKNALYGFFGFLLLQILLITGGGFSFYADPHTVPQALLTANPTALIAVVSLEHLLIQNGSSWFCLTQSSFSLPFFECFTLLFWAGICGICTLFAIRKFRREGM